VTDPDGALAALAGQGPVTGEHVLQAALAGDPKAQAIFAEVGDWLGIGIASLITLFDFELVVVGGGVGGAGDLILRPARASFERFVFARAHRELPEIVHATLGPDAGWIGAAILALDEYAEVSATSVDQTLRQPTDTSAVDKKGDYGQADHPIPGPDLPPRTQHAVSTR
jgi:glucokinase